MAFSASLESKLAIIHTIATKWKEKYDALVVDCRHRLCSCGDIENESLKKVVYLGRLTSLRALFRPRGTLWP